MLSLLLALLPLFGPTIGFARTPPQATASITPFGVSNDRVSGGGARPFVALLRCARRLTTCCALQKMNQLRLSAEESQAKSEEFAVKVKTLEQENLQKEQEIVSLTHKNSVLEAEVEKFETQVKELKATASEGQQHGTQNETLTRRLQLLEEEAEEADRTLREANEK